ncbi:hypothetical protein [Arthrobacter burdickii]|uniref:Uncharacterized protein n=1 Tax=Arthrobacter burdickii TaxID=3035920 RepID=A0ABT8JWK7_9MICC|nr:hypothetical protein [Arthrobacter burdickii]MDN4609558.1 hypothetical protein [Arthrobacter burdickii]
MVAEHCRRVELLGAFLVLAPAMVRYLETADAAVLRKETKGNDA